MFAPTTQRIDLSSSALAWCQWEPRGALLLCWRDRAGRAGKVYRYTPVDPTLFRRFMESASRGKFANWVIVKQCAAEGPL